MEDAKISYRKFQCQICGKEFPQYELEVHYLEHSKVKVKSDPEDKFECDICGKVMLKYSRTRHMKLVHKDPGNIHKIQDQYICDICDKNFETKSKLEKHSSIHRSERPFQCVKCGTCFKRKDAVEYHVKLYHSSNRKSYPCDKCDKLFLTKSLLNRHSAMHNDYRPFECNDCDQTFKRKCNLDRHIARFHTQKKFK